MKRELTITRVARVEAAAKPFTWRWAEENREAIAENWQRRIAAKPKMFNGRVLMLSDVSVTPELGRNTYFETDYANLVAWIDMGHPDPTVANGFAMAALRGADGAFICGVMSHDTVNGGRVYFPAGTPDRSDMRADGTVDLATSLTRELAEETGLTETDYGISDEWIVIERWPAVALMRYATLRVPAAEGAERIRATIAAQDQAELSDVRIIRGVEDIDPKTMPLYLQSFFRWSFSADPALSDSRTGLWSR
ncbi:NUDIX hydrolase [Microvirga sp. 17 mud 1-3]|uniref:NUDIX hydrolase n=1 Tax=Microvirga sp. 17 mud 1-3 TaxID=2082949 RepID=UPI000D6D68DE|nr:NUDIX hydrolase [Microvirga sp. 17 mud 1-3]AWM86307.1 NUDIX hydrolase [Microvirga sp. 17 mud 1-3]